MERDKKIEKINAYRKLLDTTLKATSKVTEIQDEVQTEFKNFVETQLKTLMGEGSETTTFSKDEVNFLKQFIAKASAHSAPANRTNPQPAAPRPVDPSIRQVRKTGPIPTAKDAQKVARNRDAYVNTLEAMEDAFDPDAPLEPSQGRY